MSVSRSARCSEPSSEKPFSCLEHPPTCPLNEVLILRCSSRFAKSSPHPSCINQFTHSCSQHSFAEQLPCIMTEFTHQAPGTALVTGTHYPTYSSYDFTWQTSLPHSAYYYFTVDQIEAIRRLKQLSKVPQIMSEPGFKSYKAFINPRPKEMCLPFSNSCDINQSSRPVVSKPEQVSESPRELVKHRLMGPVSTCFDSVGWDEAQECTFLSSFHIVLMMLAGGTHSGNHCSSPNSLSTGILSLFSSIIQCLAQHCCLICICYFEFFNCTFISPLYIMLCFYFSVCRFLGFSIQGLNAWGAGGWSGISSNISQLFCRALHLLGDR